MLYSILLYVILLPALCCGVLLLGLWWRKRTVADIQEKRVEAREAETKLVTTRKYPGGWWGGVAVGAGLWIGYIGLFGWPQLPALNSEQWLLWLLPIAILFGIWDIRRPDPRTGHWLARAVFLGGCQWLMFRARMGTGGWGAENWTVIESILYLVVMTALALGFWWLLEAVGEEMTDPSFAWLLMLLGIGASLVFVQSASLRYGQISGILVSTLGAWWLLSFLGQRMGWWESHVTGGIIPVLTLVFTGLCYNAYVYADLSLPGGLLLLATPLMLWLMVRYFAPRHRWQRVLLGTGFVLLFAGIAFALTFLPTTPSKSSQYPYTKATHVWENS